jgi:hypothetical protein
MRLFIPLFIFILTCQVAQSQFNYAYNMEFNNVRTRFIDNGLFFNNPQAGVGRYEIPKGSDRHIIYSGQFWFGGVDELDQIKFSGDAYYGTAYGAGPLTLGTAQPMTSPGQWMWSVYRSEIVYHIANYQNEEYEMPIGIANWPAHGNVAEGFSYNLAPFIDVNGNGVYEPQAGDHPCIKGDHAIFIIMNDKSGSVPNPNAMGLELHYMFYQFASNDYLNNTTFVDLTVFNRGTMTLNDFKTTFFVDGDIGNYADDYFGCDSTKNVAYFYNGDEFDDMANGSLGYGSNPPAFGVVSLNQEMWSFSSFEATSATPFQMYNQMNGNLPDGSPMLNMQGQPTKFIYSGNPLTLAGDSEVAAANPPGDRRALITSNFGTFLAGDTLELSYAIIYQQSPNPTVNEASDVIDMASVVREFYQEELSNSCLGAIAGLNKLENEKLTIYPNPHSKEFIVQFDNVQDELIIEVHTLSGKQILSEEYELTSFVKLNFEGPAGVYLLTVQTNKGKLVQKVIKE